MKNRASIAAALILIAVGGWFLAVELFPPVKSFAYGSATWPIPIIGIGALLALVGLLTWVPGMLIPACIVSGIGGLLYWQNATGEWATWVFAWTLIPGFVGIGLVLFGLLSRRRGALIGGGWVIFNSLVLFAVFGSFLGGLRIVTLFWPVLVITLGIVLIGQGFFRRRV